MEEDIAEICDLVKPDFIFDVTPDSAGAYYKAVAGHYKSVFIQGTKYCDEASAVYTLRAWKRFEKAARSLLRHAVKTTWEQKRLLKSL